MQARQQQHRYLMSHLPDYMGSILRVFFLPQAYPTCRGVDRCFGSRTYGVYPNLIWTIFLCQAFHHEHYTSFWGSIIDDMTCPIPWTDDMQMILPVATLTSVLEPRINSRMASGRIKLTVRLTSSTNCNPLRSYHEMRHRRCNRHWVD